MTVEEKLEELGLFRLEKEILTGREFVRGDLSFFESTGKQIMGLNCSQRDLGYILG